MNTFNPLWGDVNGGVAPVGERAGIQKGDTVIYFKMCNVGVTEKGDIRILFFCGEIQRGQTALDIIRVTVSGKNAFALTDKKL